MSAVKVKKSGGKKFSQNLRSKFSEIWAAGDADKWFTFAKLIDPRTTKAIKTKGPNLVTACIKGHTDNDPSLYITPSKGMCKCFSCGYREHNPIRFWSEYSGKSNSEVIKELQNYFNIKILTATQSKEVEKEARFQKYRNWLASSFRSHLVNAITKWQECGEDAEKFKKTEYYYAQKTLEYLKGRQILDSCYLLQLGLFPQKMQLKNDAEKAVDSKGNGLFPATEVIEILEYFQKIFEYTAYLGSMVFWYNSSPVDVSRFRLRLPTKDDAAKSIIAIEDPYEEKLGYYGLGLYGKDVKRIYVVEGEFDQAQYAALAAKEGNNDLAIIAHSGSTSHDLTDLAAFGIEEIGYIPDHDDGGERNTKEILKANPQFKFKIFSWPHGVLDPKKEKTDLDDSLKLYGFYPVHEALNDWDRNWIKPEAWVKARIEESIKSASLQDPFEISKLVLSYAPCIGSTNDPNQTRIVNKWIQDTLTELGVSNSDIKTITNDYLSKDSEEELFVRRLGQKIRERIEFIYVDRNKAATPVTCWDKRTHDIITMRTGSEAAVKSSMAMVFGILVEWVRAELSVPNFIKYFPAQGEEEEHGAERSYLLQEEDIVRYCTVAFKEIVSALPSEGEFKIVTAGVHELETSLGPQIFVVNGSHIYIMTFDKEGKHVEELENPVYETYFFRTGKVKAWTPHATLEALRKPSSCSLKNLITRTHAIIDTGWSFKDQKTEPWSLAVLAVAATTLCVFPQNLQFLASNERSTGKSTLYADLFGGKNADIHLVEHTRFFDGATPAGIRQNMNGSSLVLIIDEFDNQVAGAYNAEKMDSVMKILRVTSSGEGTDIYGTPDGESKTYYLNFSSMIAGIDPNITEANMTRFFPTELQSGLDHRVPPRTAILSKFSVQELETLKRDITLNGFDYIPLLRQSYNLVKKECTEDPTILGSVNLQRFKDSIMILCTYMCAAEMDWKTWARNTCAAKSERVEMVSAQTSNTNLISAILHSPIMASVSNITRKVKVSDFFNKSYLFSEKESLNTSGSGVYIVEDKEKSSWYLLINWQESIVGVLKGNPYLRVQDKPANLMAIAARYPNSLNKAQIRELYTRLPDIPGWVVDVPCSMIDITAKIATEFERNKAAQEYARQNYPIQVVK